MLIIFNEFIITEKIKDLRKIKDTIGYSNINVKDYSDINFTINELENDMLDMLNLIQRVNKYQDIIGMGFIIEDEFFKVLNCIKPHVDKLLKYMWNDEQDKILVAINTYIKDYIDILKEMLDIPLYQIEKISGYRLVLRLNKKEEV